MAPQMHSTCAAPMAGGFSRTLPISEGASPAWRLPIWIWLDYPNGTKPHRYTHLNIQVLQRHAPQSHFCVHIVNRTNIADYVSDLPKEFWKLPTPVAFSDAARLALLTHHGGLYLDTDFIVLRSLVPIANLLGNVDVIGSVFSRTHGLDETADECSRSGRIAANFLAVRRNTTLLRGMWHELQRILAMRCNKRRRDGGVCCSRLADSTVGACHVPHALTDHMLSWWHRTGKYTQQPGVVYHCLAGSTDLSPPRLIPENPARSLAYVLNQSGPALRYCYGKWRLLSRSIGHCELCGGEYPGTVRKAVCCNRDGEDLVCHTKDGMAKRGVAVSRGFYAPTRLAYHMYDSFQRHIFGSHTQIEWSSLAVAPLYRRALGLAEHMEGPANSKRREWWPKNAVTRLGAPSLAPGPQFVKRRSLPPHISWTQPPAVVDDCRCEWATAPRCRKNRSDGTRCWTICCSGASASNRIVAGGARVA